MSEGDGKSSSAETAQLSHYLVFAKIMCENLSFVKTLSQCIDQAEYDSFAAALVNISVKAGRTLPLINAVVASEFERNFRTPGSIMRGNCVASKLMGAYSRKLCGEYLQKCIGDLVTDIVMDESLSLEIDPRKCGDNMDVVKKNMSVLKKKATAFVERITSDEMLEIVPREIRAISGFTADYARTYASDRLIPLIGGFFMLRLYNPCLVTPESMGLLPSGVKPTASARRNLTLITKLLQNLSNGILFGSKEPYMTPMNPFIESQQKKMNRFLTKLATDPQATEDTPPWEDCLNSPTKELTADGLELGDLTLIHSLIYNYKGKLLEMLQEEIEKNTDKDWTQEELLFETLDKLSVPKSTSRKDRNIVETIQFLRPPEKSGHVTKKKDKAKKRYWIVLTDKFLHFFESAHETRPRKSIPLDDITIEVADIGIDTECYFPLIYNRRNHVFFCQNAQMVEDWTRAICTGKLRQARHRAPEIDKKLSALEKRIQNHRMGRKLDYSFSFSSFHAEESGRVTFEFTVQAFSAKFTIKKTFAELLELHMELTKLFPRIIFPSFPVNIGEWPSSKEEQRYRQVSQTVQSAPDTPVNEKKRVGGKKARFVSSRNTGPMPPKLMLSHFQGHPSFGVLIMVKFLRAYVEDVSNNLQVSQSDPVLKFIGVLSTYRAVKEDCMEQLNYLLKKAAEEKRKMFDEHDEFGETPLHYAAMLNNTALIEWMIENGADVGIRAKDNGTPLHRALEFGSIDAAHLLLEMRAPVDVENSKKETPLHIAATFGYEELCQTMVQCGASVGAYDNKGRPPIQRAIRYNWPEIAQLFIEHGSNTSYRDTYGNTLIHLAAAADMIEVASALLTDRRVNINAQGRYRATALHIAAKVGSEDMVKLLLDNGADAKLSDIEDSTPLHVAAHEGHAGVIDILSGVCDIEARSQIGVTAAHLAAMSGSAEAIAALARAGADLNARDTAGCTPLHLGVDCSSSVVRELLCRKAKTDVVDERSLHPIHLAILLGRIDAVKLLMKHGADIAVGTQEGDSPLHVAIWARHLDIVKVLAGAGAPLNARDNRGSTPLHIAVQTNEMSIVKYLIPKVDVNLARNDGYTAMHLVAEHDFTTLGVMLLETDVNVNAQNNDEDTALHIAVRRGNETLAVYLAEHGANPNITNKHNVSPVTDTKGGKMKTQLLEAYSKFQDGGRATGSAPAAKSMPEHLVKVWLVDRNGDRARSHTINVNEFSGIGELRGEAAKALGVDSAAKSWSYETLDLDEVDISDTTTIEELLNEATALSLKVE